ncbi:MAG: 3'(2'),5'-bisphosphate nucleotidase CysQ [Hyphomicrobiales bacterium]|nr:3'(2'),5'-bisphosphate nucleotidase CysQ [Hyphomicrobiales bacterium]
MSESLTETFARLALAAGAVVMRIYGEGAQVRAKPDLSPVCDADEGAEAVIVEGLARAAPHLPIVAEEAVARSGAPAAVARFALVDPLDGTREFIARNGEFTVNIALIEGGAPVAGVVYAPALGALWLGDATGAFACSVAAGADLPTPGQRRAIHVRPAPREGAVALCSRSHGDAQTEAYLRDQHIVARRIAGSSVKFCLIAQGDADLYPRFSPTMEWDTAAGDAVLRAAGGMVATLDGAPLTYGKSGFRNSAFVARGGASSTIG